MGGLYDAATLHAPWKGVSTFQILPDPNADNILAAPLNSTCQPAKENSTNATWILGSNLPSKLKPLGHKANGIQIHSYTTPCTSNAIRQPVSGPGTDWICSCTVYKQHACLYNSPGYFPCRLWSKPCEHSKPQSAVPPLSMTKTTSCH